MPVDVNTGKKLKLIETDDINKVPFEQGQYIIVNDGMVYYDPTIGKNIDDRKCLTPKRELDVYTRADDKSDEYYLSLHTLPIIGDLVIIKDLIPNTDKYSYTIYIYNNNDEDTNNAEWCKLTGNYNAKDVYFTKDIQVTVDVESLTNGKNIIKSAGKNLEDVLTNIFSPELNPTITQPSVILSFPESGTYEIGSVITPTYSMVLDPGKYEYGPETSVTPLSYMATGSNGVTINSQSGSFAEIIVDESTNFSISAYIVHSNGSVPLTNKNSEYADGSIISGSVTTNSHNISGYLNGIYYGCSQETKTHDNITGEFIRTLNKSGKSYEIENINLKVPVGTKSIIIACPTTNTGVGKIYNNTANCDMTQAFGDSSEISINTNSELTDYARAYNVWIYNPAEPYEIEANLTISLI